MRLPVKLMAVALAGLMVILSGCTGGKSQETTQTTQTETQQPQGSQEQSQSQTQQSQQETKDEPVTGGEIVVGDIGDAESLNPIYSNDTASSFIVELVSDALVRVNDKLEIVPWLATEWDVSEDGKVWTFHMRKDAKWHDGQPVTARDAAFTYFSILHPLYAGTRQSNYDSILGYAEAKKKYDAIKQDFKDGKIDEATRDAKLEEAFAEFKAAGGIKVIDDYTIQITLEKPYAPFLAFAMGMELIPEHILGGVRPDKMKEHETNRKPLGSGRYKFVEWKTGDRIVLEANPDWWGGRPYIDRIIYRVIPDQNAIAVALEAGEIDVGTITPELFERFQGKEGLKLFEYQQLSYTYLGYNLRRPLFQDVRVRRAITHAIDRQAIVEAILLGHGTVAHSHSAPIRWDYNPNLTTYDYNPERAKQLLAEAGWTPGSDGILTKDGQRFQFSLLTNQNKVREQVITIIQQQLKEVGIEVEPKVVEWSSFVSQNLLGQDFDAVVVGWSLGVDPDSYSIWHSSQTEKGRFNFVGFQNERVDKLLEEGRVTTDPEKRKQIYAEMQQILAEEQPYTFLFFPNTIEVLRDKFRGPIAGNPAGLMWNVEKWWIPKDLQ